MTDQIQQLQSAFASEEGRRNALVYSASELPLAYESITDEWLTEALCSAVPGARVMSHTLGAVDSGTSNRRKITVAYNEVGAAGGLPGKLFCKATHGITNRITLGVSGGASAEVNFYNHVRALLDLQAPVGYFARFEPANGNSLIILGDLAVEDTGFCDHRTLVSRAEAEDMVRLLAELHGRAYSDPAIKANHHLFLSWTDYFSNTLKFGLQAGSTQGFRDAREVVPARLYERIDEIWPATLASLETNAAQPQTLCHGDVHIKNWYRTREGAMGLSDWQCLHRGHWSRDFAYAVSCALQVEDRRAWEKDLLRLYLDALREAGGQKIEFDAAWRLYRQQLLTALTWWTVTLSPPPGMPDMQPRDTTLAFIHRISTAMDDLESLQSFAT